jgi:hypothetical protein
MTFQDQAADLPTALTSLEAWHPNPVTGWSTILRHPIAHLRWYGNVDPLSIAYGFCPRLRPD